MTVHFATWLSVPIVTLHIDLGDKLYKAVILKPLADYFWIDALIAYPVVLLWRQVLSAQVETQLPLRCRLDVAPLAYFSRYTHSDALFAKRAIRLSHIDFAQQEGLGVNCGHRLSYSPSFAGRSCGL